VQELIMDVLPGLAHVETPNAHAMARQPHIESKLLAIN
jgi:hypothetical protein